MSDEPDPTKLRRRKTDQGLGVNLVVAVIVVLAVFGMGATTIYNSLRVRDIASQADARADCNTRVLTDLLEAVNERTTYTEALASRNVDQLKAFAALVEASLRQPPPDEAESRQIVITYRNALDTYLHVADQAKQQRQDNPYPTVKQIEACR